MVIMKIPKLLKKSEYLPIPMQTIETAGLNMTNMINIAKTDKFRKFLTSFDIEFPPCKCAIIFN